MAIKIDGNFVCIGGFCFCETPTGIQFDGEAQSTLFCDLRLSPVQGLVSGYASGGKCSPPVSTDLVDKFPFTSDTPATDTLELSQTRCGLVGQSSSICGYSSGGNYGGPSTPITNDRIDRFSFSSENPATDTGNLTQSRMTAGGQSSQTHGYTSGGKCCGPPSGTIVDTIDKFPFAVNSNASNVGELNCARDCLGGQSSITDGYVTGGAPGSIDMIQKFPFATDSNATDVGELSRQAYGTAGISSLNNGYATGGYSPGVYGMCCIQKFPFESSITTTVIGSLTFRTINATGVGSSSFGYTAGGSYGGTFDTIDKFPFAADSNATDVGELVGARRNLAGQQV